MSWSAAGAGLSSKMCNKDNYSGPLPHVSSPSEGFYVGYRPALCSQCSLAANVYVNLDTKYH